MAGVSFQKVTADAFARLAVELHVSGGVEDVVEAIADFARNALDCTHTGIAIARRGRPQNLLTDPVVAQLYEYQIEHHQGPMLTAYREQRRVWVPDTAADTRWSGWHERALQLGIRTVMHVPLRAGDRPDGVLSLYHRLPGAFGADDTTVAEVLARHASIAVANARRRQALTEALGTRRLVGQAIGILMERYDLDETRAFEVLKRYSQSTNTKLRVVAEELIATRRLPMP